MNNHVNKPSLTGSTADSLGSALPTGTWRLDPSQTTVTVTAKKMGFIKVAATLAVSAGTIEIDADNRVTAVEVMADATSYTSGNAKRDEHVRSDDFLAGDDHPRIVFRADQVSPTAEGYRADGSVTVKGRTSPLAVTIDNVEYNARSASFTATATIDRTAIGVDKLPSLIIGRQLQLAVTATAVPAEA